MRRHPRETPPSPCPGPCGGLVLTVPTGAASGDVFARERQDDIARLVTEQGRVRVRDLATRFGVSTVTIRKDLVVLESEGRLTRTHGGALTPVRDRPEPAFDLRERLQQDEKARIGAAAAALVHDGDSIVMDASTTGLAVARRIRQQGGWSQLTVITNGLRIATELAGTQGITVLMTGGRVRWQAMSVVGHLGDGLFDRINVQTAFVGAAGFALEPGLSDATEEEAQIKRSMVAAARRVIAIVDHTKWQRVTFATFCRTDDIDAVLTDDQAPPDMVRDLRARGIEVTMIPPGPAHDGDRRGRGRGGGASLAGGRLEVVRRDPGADRRLARPARRRGPRAGRGERRRQEHPGQDPGRRPPARRRDHPRRRRAAGDRGPGPGAGARDRGRPPGAAAVPRPHGRRERVHRPRAVRTAADRRLGRDAPAGADAVRGARRQVRRPGAGPRHVDGGPAADRDRQGAVGRGGRADPRRAHGLAVGPRGRPPVHDRPRPAGPRRGGAVREPSPGRGVRPVRHRDRAARRPPRHHDAPRRS